MMTAVVAPENNFDNPYTEKKAAQASTKSADRPSSMGKVLPLMCIEVTLSPRSQDQHTLELTQGFGGLALDWHLSH